jgi:hypothetical protein
MSKNDEEKVRALSFENDTDVRIILTIKVTGELCYVASIPYPVDPEEEGEMPKPCSGDCGEACDGKGDCHDKKGVVMTEENPNAGPNEPNFVAEVMPGFALAIEVLEGEMIGWTNLREPVGHVSFIESDFPYGLRYGFTMDEGEDGPTIHILRNEASERSFRLKNGLSQSIVLGYKVMSDSLQMSFGSVPEDDDDEDEDEDDEYEDDASCHGTKEVTFDKTATDAPDYVRIIKPGGWFTVPLRKQDMTNWHSCQELVDLVRIDADHLPETPWGLDTEMDANGLVEPTTLVIVPERTDLN